MFVSRLNYYLKKIRRASSDGSLSGRIRRKLVVGAAMRLSSSKNYLFLRPADKRLSIADGFASRVVTGEPGADEAIVSRIIRAYKAAKIAQKATAPQFAVRGLWAEWIEINYKDLIKAANDEDVGGLVDILRNFCRQPFAIGTGSSYDDVVHYKTSVFGRAYIKTVWCDYRDKLSDAGFDLSKLVHPDIGNPAGLSMNGTVIPIETLRHAYNGFAISNLLRDVSDPTVVEIGGGFGGQAFQTIHQMRTHDRPVGKYFDFDIPEVLIPASYFLLKAFPDLQIRLFGEDPDGVSGKFDVGIFPHFTIDHLTDLSVDLVFNSNSFSEMDDVASEHYLAVIGRTCKRYFMHVNHEERLIFSYPDGSSSRNLVGSELVPDPEKFKRIYKRPRIFQRPEDRPFKSFVYLYERMQQPSEKQRTV